MINLERRGEGKCLVFMSKKENMQVSRKVMKRKIEKNNHRFTQIRNICLL